MSLWILLIFKDGVETVLMKEGCLTFPFLFLNISRPRIIEVEYEDVDGKVIKELFIHKRDVVKISQVPQKLLHGLYPYYC